MVPLVMAGLQLLPQIPEIWSSIAGLFGKKAPKGVAEAGKMASGILDAFKKGDIPPDVQLAMEKELHTHEEKIKELAFKELELKFKETELEYNNVSDMIDLEKQSYKTDDQYVRRTRPMILRKLFIGCIAYAFYAPIFIVLLSYVSVSATSILTIIEMLKWIGGWLFGTFSTAYLGYTAGRSIDKRNPEFKNGQNLINKAAKVLLEKG